MRAHGGVRERRAEQRKVLLLLDQFLSQLRGLIFERGIVVDRELDLRTVHAACSVDLLHRQVHAVSALGPVNAAGAGDRQDRSELDHMGCRAAFRAASTDNDGCHQAGNQT